MALRKARSNFTTPSEVHSSLSGADLMARGRLSLNREQITAGILAELSLIGVSIGQDALDEMIDGLGFDAAPDLAGLSATVNSVGTPIQFLQAWLPGFVHVVTAARKADEILGVMTVGSWEDEEIIQGTLEPTGLAQPYGDYTPIPLSSWNVNFERRSIVRFEQGMEVGKLEELRAGAMRVNSAGTKRNAAAMALEIQRNRIGFYGFNQGNNRTYGYLNEPTLPAYVNVASNAGNTSTTWPNKTFQEIIADFRAAFAALDVASQDVFDAASEATTCVIPTGKKQYLNVTTDYGQSVREWLAKNYPKMRIVTAPELAGANGGADVMILSVDRIVDGASDDNGEVFAQMVPTKFMTLGVDKKAKSYHEDYSNATAGVLLKRPYGVTRRSGI